MGMAGYVASARLQGGVPHFVGGGGLAAWSGDQPHGAASGSADDLAWSLEPVDLVGRPLDQVIGDWLASLGESWSQLTFFLFDPDSWR
jgi:hypothetical protein